MKKSDREWLELLLSDQKLARAWARYLKSANKTNNDSKS